MPMLVFALMLIAGGLIVSAALITFVAENIVALVCAILAAQAALATGGGWPGALVAAALVFAVVSAGLRLAILLTPSLIMRLALAGLIIAPAALASFIVTEALLSTVVPAALWRIGLALVAAGVSAAAAHGRLAALRPAA